MSDAALGFLSWGRVGSRLRKLRLERYPTCQNLDRFTYLLESEPIVRDVFGFFRTERFYQGTLYVGGETLVVFVIEQLMREIRGVQTELYFDGTFSILPFRMHQLFVVMATVGGIIRT